MRKPGTMAKPENLTFRTNKEIRDILERLAKEGYRSVSQQIEMIVIQWLKTYGHLKDPPEE